jgi:hypothetical protein
MNTTHVVHDVLNSAGRGFQAGFVKVFAREKQFPVLPLQFGV